MKFMIPTYITKYQRQLQYPSQSNARAFSLSFRVKQKTDDIVQALDSVLSEQCNSGWFPIRLCSYSLADHSGSLQGVRSPFSISSSVCSPPNYSLSFPTPSSLPFFFLLMSTIHTFNSNLYNMATIIKELTAFAREQICVLRVLMIILKTCPRVT